MPTLEPINLGAVPAAKSSKASLFDKPGNTHQADAAVQSIAKPLEPKKSAAAIKKPELVTPQIDKRISKFNLAGNTGLPPEPGFSAVKNLWQEREKSKVSTNFEQTFPQPTKSEALSASHKNKTVKPASLMKQALDIMVPAAHASELPDVESKQSSMQQMRAKLEQDFREADDFFAPLVPQQEQDANISSVKDFMSSPESYHNNHSEPTVLDALLYAAGRGTGGMQSIAKDAEVLVDPFGFQEAMRTGNITNQMQRTQNLSDGIAATYETVRKDGLLPIFNSRVQHYQNQMSAARNQAERGNFFGAGYTSGEAQMDVAKDALALTGLGYGAAGLGRLAGRQAMNQGKLLYQMGTMGVEQGRAAFALADGLNAPFLGRGYSAPIDRAARGFDLSRTDPRELFPPQAGRPDTVGQPLLHQFSLFEQPKLPNAGKLTKGQIVDYLQNVDKVPLKQLTTDLERLGFELLEYRPDEKIYKFSHVKNNGLRRAGKSKAELELITEQAKANLKSAKVMVEIHCDAKSGPHLHITDAKGNVYDKHLNNLTEMIAKKFPNKDMDTIIKKSERLPEAHIKIKEFVELNMRLDNA